MKRENLNNVDFSAFDLQQPELPIRGHRDARRTRKVDQFIAVQPGRYEIGDSEVRIDTAIWRMLLELARLNGVEQTFDSDMTRDQASAFGNVIEPMLSATAAVLKLIAH